MTASKTQSRLKNYSSRRASMSRLGGLKVTFENRYRKVFCEMHLDEQFRIKAHLGMLLEWSPAPNTHYEPKIGVETPALQE